MRSNLSPSPTTPNTLPLLEREIPSLLLEQIDAFTPDAMRVEQVGKLDIVLPEGQSVVAVDIGGDTLTASEVTVVNGNLQHSILVDLSGVEGGKDYVEALELVDRIAQEKSLKIGVSSNSPIKGTKLVGGVNVPIFMKELSAKYDGDLGKLLSSLAAIDNDAVAGLRRGSLESRRQVSSDTNVIYVINGSGLNTAFLINGQMASSESGHVQADARLNTFGQQKQCGLLGAKYVCVEAIAANKAGIESTWHQQAGSRLDGKEIEALYLKGNTLAGDLYANSALVIAHLIAGAAKGMGLNLQDGSTTIVSHGGAFKFPGYSDRIMQILSHNLGSNAQMLLTKDFSPNACLEGAALAAFAKL